MLYRKKAKSRWLLIISIIFVGGFCYCFMYYFNLFRSIASYAAYPVLLVHATVIEPCHAWLQEKKTHRMLKQMFLLSKCQQDRLLEENIALRGQLQYMQDTAELQTFRQRYNLEGGTITRVLVRHFSEQAHYFFIDAGSSKGVDVDMVAIDNNCLIGKVTEVYPWYSKVTLITDRQCKVAGCCLSTHAQGIHEGINVEDEATLSHVSHLAQLTLGDMIMSSGEGLVFPQGFALGRVMAVNPDGLYQKISVKPLGNFRTINYCMVLPKGLTSSQIKEN